MFWVLVVAASTQGKQLAESDEGEGRTQRVGTLRVRSGVLRLVEVEVVDEVEQLAYRKFLGSCFNVCPRQCCERESALRAETEQDNNSRGNPEGIPQETDWGLQRMR